MAPWYAIGASIFIFFLYSTLFMIGCWEAMLAIQNEPTNESTPGFINGYAYTVFACIVNIMSSCLLILMIYFKNDEEIPAFITCAISIWTIVLVAGMINDDIRTGPFQSVVVAQFIITIVGFLLCLCSCSGFMVLSSFNPPKYKLTKYNEIIV